EVLAAFYRVWAGPCSWGDPRSRLRGPRFAISARVPNDVARLFGRKEFGDRRAGGVLVILAAEVGRDVVRVRPLAGRDLTGRLADGFAVFRDYGVFGDGLQGDLMAGRDVFARSHFMAVGDDFRPRQDRRARNRDVVFLVEQKYRSGGVLICFHFVILAIGSGSIHVEFTSTTKYLQPSAYFPFILRSPPNPDRRGTALIKYAAQSAMEKVCRP